ncbi:uncharacterized protein LOC141629514 [Silene latifolia]|uniref:uncharacterized protein LOC141629514 n=1 Tax=Silene latifolia TaxID=37657 RepID=UPI003D77312C
MAFNSCLASCSLDDRSSTGTDFTWTNKKDHLTRVWFKLDRVLVNQSWSASFPFSSAHFHESDLSDHSPVVRNSVKYSLKHLHPSHFSKISDRVKAAKLKLKKSPANLLNDPFSANLIQEKQQAIKEFSRLKTIELSILQQRAKITHLQNTDSSSKYFFAKIAERRHLQFIGLIKDKHGVLHSGQDGVTNAFQDYYSYLLGSQQTISALDVDLLRRDGCLLPADHHNLTKNITLLEIKEAVFSIDSNSSPGIDGFSSGFFKSAWSIIEKDFCAAVLSFF